VKIKESTVRNGHELFLILDRHYIYPKQIDYNIVRGVSEVVTALMNNKKLLILMIFLLCAGCFHEKPSTSSPSVRTSLQNKRNFSFSVVTGASIRVNAQITPTRLTPTKALSFVDELHGFGLVSGIRDLPLVQTSDGGMNWQAQSRLAHTTAPSALSFLDSRTGWLLTSESSGQKSELRLTSDGGQTWEVIAQDLPGLDLGREALFFHFFDRQEGLVAAKSDKDMVLLRTQDGGITWSASNRIPMPMEGVFTFRSSTEGWFIGSSKKAKEGAILYHMTDGETWQEAGRLPPLLIPRAISFANSQKGFILLHTDHQSRENEQIWQLLRTNDGGKTWSLHEFPSSFQPLDESLQLSFLTWTSGWILDARDLWRTKDGGLNWSMLTP
jgi:photosystem II stability/assembly factor-like uncharacterized protein